MGAVNLGRENSRSKESLALAEVSAASVVLWALAAAAPAALLVALAGVLPGVSPLASCVDSLWTDFPARAFLVVGDLAITAVVEEIIFRGLLLCGLVWAFRAIDHSASLASAISRAIVLQAIAFSLAHVVGLGIPPAESFLIAALQLLAKLVQAFLFAVCMAYLLLKTANLLLPIFVHFAFDLIYFAPTVLASGFLPETYLTGSLFDLAVVATSAAILAIPAVRVLIEAKRGVHPRLS